MGILFSFSGNSLGKYYPAKLHFHAQLILLTKPIAITVTEHITPTTPRKYSYKIRNQNCHSDLFRVAYILIYCFYTVINGFNNCNCCSLRKFCIYPSVANSESTSENNFSHTSGLVVVRN